MGLFLFIVGVIAAALALTVYWYGRSKKAEIEADQCAEELNDFLSANVMLQQTKLEGHQIMLHQALAAQQQTNSDATYPNRRKEHSHRG